MIDLTLDLADPVQRFKLRDAVRALKERRYKILIKEDHPKRSVSQNAFYWRICEIFAGWARDMGNDDYTKEKAHAFFGNQFLPDDTVGKAGEIIGHSVKSTTTLTTKEMSEYLEQCIRFLAEYCEIELPPTMIEDYRATQQKPNSADGGA